MEMILLKMEVTMKIMTRFFLTLACAVSTTGLFASSDNSPLQENHFGVQIKGGVAPAHYTQRGPVWLTVPTLTPAVFTVSTITKFRDQFEMPWEVAGELEWNASKNVQFFLEGVYNRAKGKQENFLAGNFVVQEINSDYKTWGGYIGARYFFDRVFGDISPFLGFKAGLVHQDEMLYQLFLSEAVTFVQTSPYYLEQKTAVSGGLQGGLDWKLTCHLSLVLTAEVVYTQGLKNNRHNVITNPIPPTQGLTNVSIGETSKVVTYPVTLGLRYEF